MSGLVPAAIDWLAARGPPNWVFVLALITSPAAWSDAVRKRVRPLLERLLPAPEGSK